MDIVQSQRSHDSTYKWCFFHFKTVVYQENKTQLYYTVCILSPECYTNSRTNMMSIINAFYFFVFSSLIDYGFACVNSQLTWTCQGGYLQVQMADWSTNRNCGSDSYYERHSVLTHLQNTCNNKVTCDFNVTEPSFSVSCVQTCTGLDYDYKCISKSFVLRSLLIIFSSI